MERRIAREERRSLVVAVLASIWILLILASSVQTAMKNDRLQNENYFLGLSNDLLMDKVAEQAQELAASRIEGSAVVECGVPTIIKTPLGRLRITSQQARGDPGIKVWAKFLDYGGYTWDLETTGRWGGTHTKTGYQIQVAPEGYSLGYEWNYDKNGDYTTIRKTHWYFTVWWMKNPEWTGDEPLPPPPPATSNM